MFLRVTVAKIIEVPDWTEEEAEDSTPEGWYEAHFLAGDASLDAGEYESINYDLVHVERVEPDDN